MPPRINFLTMIRDMFALNKGVNNTTSSPKDHLLSFESKSKDTTTLGYEKTTTRTNVPKDIDRSYAQVEVKFPPKEGVENLRIPEEFADPTCESDMAYWSKMEQDPTVPEYAEA